MIYAKIFGEVIREAYVEDEFGNMSAGFRLDGGKRIDHLCEVKEKPLGVISFTSPLRALDESGLTKYSRFVAFQFNAREMSDSLFLIVPAPADEKWARLDDGPVPWETWRELPPLKLDRRWWVGNVRKVPKDVVPDELGVYQISLFRFEWPVQRRNGRLISVPICYRRQSDIDAQAEYSRKREENYDKSFLPQAEGIVSRLLSAIGHFESRFDAMPEERGALELVKERLCLRLAYLHQEAHAVLVGESCVVDAKDVLFNKRQFFGKNARLQHPSPSDPDLMLYKAQVKRYGAKEPK
jgi:hypothetical protein